MTARDDWHTPAVDDLVAALTSLDDPEEMALFLRDLCTHREVTDLSHRWQIARLLDEGLPYREIAERTGASTATVTRVAQWLNHGMGGYRTALERMKASS